MVDFLESGEHRVPKNSLPFSLLSVFLLHSGMTKCTYTLIDKNANDYLTSVTFKDYFAKIRAITAVNTCFVSETSLYQLYCR